MSKYQIIQRGNVKVIRSAPVHLTLIGDGGALREIGETPLGAINGVNATFASLYPFVPSTLTVYLNGIRQKIVEDYQAIGGTTILFLVSPTTGEDIVIDYQRI